MTARKEFDKWLCEVSERNNQYIVSKGIVELMFWAWQASHANARKKQRKKLRGAK